MMDRDPSVQRVHLWWRLAFPAYGKVRIWIISYLEVDTSRSSATREYLSWRSAYLVSDRHLRLLLLLYGLRNLLPANEQTKQGTKKMRVSSSYGTKKKKEKKKNAVIPADLPRWQKIHTLTIQVVYQKRDAAHHLPRHMRRRQQLGMSCCALFLRSNARF